MLGFIGIVATIKSRSDTLSTQLSSIVQKKEIRDDGVYSKQSLECLREALDTIKTLDGKVYRHRIAWLESARLIMTSQTLAKQIKSDSMKLTYKTAEKVIRSRFGTLFDPENSPETMQPCYFYEMEWDRWAEDKKQHPIDKISAHVIHQFISWQDDELDILRTVTKINISKISQRYFGARLFLERDTSNS